MAELLTTEAITEAAMTLLPSARLWARRSSSSKLDEDLTETVAACLAELQEAGVACSVEDYLIRQAVKFCVKSHFGPAEDSDRWGKAYDRLKDTLSLSPRYRIGG